MEARPHPVVERFVGGLLPPACREHVLGDLQERFVSSSQYVYEAIWTIPFVVWGQVRRTSSAPFAIAEVGVVYVAFLSALRTFDPSAWHDGLLLVRPALPALAALVAVIIRDAWVGRRPRPSIHIAADAWLGVACAAIPQGLLVAVDSALALNPTALLAGCVVSLALLSGVRAAFSPLNQRAATANAGGMHMKPSPSNTPGRMQRDLRIWWWTIAVVGVTGWLALFLYPATQMRPFLLIWLILFVAIGAYQRRRTLWPELPAEGLETAAGRRAYRASLEHRRDQQYKWPARRRPLVIGVIALAFILGATKFLLSPNAGPLPRLMAFVVPASMAVLLVATHYFTRRFTDRAAAAFQREIDTLDSTDPGSRKD
jgi:hypothetical protein